MNLAKLENYQLLADNKAYTVLLSVTWIWDKPLW